MADHGREAMGGVQAVARWLAFYELVSAVGLHRQGPYAGSARMRNER